jgi:light-regulated signal transduction histidine kinase (bacteriophytochrome)
MPAEDIHDEVQRLRDELDRCERDMQRLLDGAVHDLRSAQRGIATSTEILRSVVGEAPNADADAAFKRLLEGTAKMNLILAGLGNYSLSLPGARHSFGPVPMGSILRSALASLEREIRESGAATTGGVPDDCQVSGDGERLRLVFRILIENALKYRSAAAPLIDIRAEPGADSWIFSVADNGIGIDAKYWKDLFTPFKRLHGSEIPGAGLGLATCRKIIEAHRGRIWIESEPGKGATFLFTLPAESGT